MDINFSIIANLIMKIKKKYFLNSKTVKILKKKPLKAILPPIWRVRKKLVIKKNIII